MILPVFLLKGEGPVSVKLRTKFYISNRENNPIEKNEKLYCWHLFQKEKQVENKKPIS